MPSLDYKLDYKFSLHIRDLVEKNMGLWISVDEKRYKMTPFCVAMLERDLYSHYYEITAIEKGNEDVLFKKNMSTEEYEKTKCFVKITHYEKLNDFELAIL